MKNEYKQVIIDEIYQEAEKDNLFFGFISGYLDIDDLYYDDENNKVDIFERTLKLIHFLMNTGDFEVGRMINSSEAIIEFLPYKNAMVGFEFDARKHMQSAGLHCEALSWELTLRKKRKMAVL